MSATSERMAIMASQKRSISASGFGLGGLDHEGTGYGEAHGGGVEAVVDETLGEVVDGDADGGLERAGVEDALVGYATVVVLVEDGVVGVEGARRCSWR